jgi:hypothetical protein
MTANALFFLKLKTLPAGSRSGGQQKGPAQVPALSHMGTAR